MATDLRKGAVGLVAACDDPALFGFPLWDRQRDLLGQIEAGPRLHVLALGRRSGKTTMGALLGLHSCLFRPDLDALVRRGERRYVVAVATRLEQSRLFVQAARSIVERSPLLARLVESANDDEIRFANGSVLLAFPCTSRGVRGYAVSTVLMDEAAHFLDTDGNQSAEPVFRALVPSTVQFGDKARVIVASTPFGAEGFFADLFSRAHTGDLEGAAAVQATSAEVNPTLSPEVLSAEHARDPEGFRGEYLAEFVGSGGAYIEAARLRDVVVERGELGRLDATSWTLGLDLGFVSDPTGLVLVGRSSPDGRVIRVGLARSWAPQRASTFEERRAIEDGVLADVAEIAQHYDATVVTDQHLAPQVRDWLSRRGVRVETLALSAETKSLAFSELRARIHDGSLELYPHEALLAELRGLRTQYRAGKSTVVTPRTSRGHSDMAVALALAVWSQQSAANATLRASTGYEFSDRDGLDDLLGTSDRLSADMGW